MLDRLESGDENEIATVEQEVDALPQDRLALMVGGIDFTTWQWARWVKEYAKQNDLEQLFGQLQSNAAKLDAIMEWLTKIPSYGTALDIVATTYPDTFAKWMNQTSDQVRTALRTRPRIEQVFSQQTTSD